MEPASRWFSEWWEAALLVLMALVIMGIFFWLGAVTKKTCPDFSNQPDAQHWSDTHDRVLDRNKNGVACETLK